MIKGRPRQKRSSGTSLNDGALLSKAKIPSFLPCFFHAQTPTVSLTHRTNRRPSCSRKNMVHPLSSATWLLGWWLSLGKMCLRKCTLHNSYHFYSKCSTRMFTLSPPSITNIILVFIGRFLSTDTDGRDRPLFTSFSFYRASASIKRLCSNVA